MLTALKLPRFEKRSDMWDVAHGEIAGVFCAGQEWDSMSRVDQLRTFHDVTCGHCLFPTLPVYSALPSSQHPSAGHSDSPAKRL